MGSYLTGTSNSIIGSLAVRGGKAIGSLPLDHYNDFAQELDLFCFFAGEFCILGDTVLLFLAIQFYIVLSGILSACEAATVLGQGIGRMRLSHEIITNANTLKLEIPHMGLQ